MCLLTLELRATCPAKPPVMNSRVLRLPYLGSRAMLCRPQHMFKHMCGLLAASLDMLCMLLANRQQGWHSSNSALRNTGCACLQDTLMGRLYLNLNTSSVYKLCTYSDMASEPHVIISGCMSRHTIAPPSSEQLPMNSAVSSKHRSLTGPLCASKRRT